MKTAISLTGLLAVFITAYGIDRWLDLMRQQAVDTFTLTQYLWYASIANLILAGELVLLAWYVNYRTNRSTLTPSIFIIVGLLVTFATAIIYTASSTFLPLGMVEYLMPNSRLVYAAALAAAIGTTGLVIFKEQNTQTTEYQ